MEDRTTAGRPELQPGTLALEPGLIQGEVPMIERAAGSGDDDRGMLPAVEEESGHPESALLARARAGDARAWERIVEANLQQVWSVAWRVVRHREDAEDVVQETFLTAWRSLSGFRGDASLSTWLHGIARSRALHLVERSAERMRRASRPLERGGDADGDGPDPEVERAALSRSPASPVRALEAGERLRRLAACLRRLPPAFRAVIALRDAESRSYQEIAKMLGIEVGTVRSRLARSRVALRECVQGGAS